MTQSVGDKPSLKGAWSGSHDQLSDFTHLKYLRNSWS